MTDAIDHGDRAHSVFAPSASSRWLRCPGSLQRCNLVPDTSSPFAEEGTRAHELAECWLLDRLAGRQPTPLVGVDPDMVEHIKGYVARCMCDLPDVVQVGVENRVDFSFLTPLPNQKGTVDFWAIIKTYEGHALILRDLKYGQGVKVYAKDNSQLLIYALALFEEWDWAYSITSVELYIDQPRLGHLDSWTVTPDDLLKFGDYVRERSALALSPDAPLVPGETQCRWCKVKADCPAVLHAINEMADDVFADVTALTPSNALSVPPAPPSLPAVERMTVEHMARVLPYRGVVEGWFKAMYERLKREAASGAEVPGWKVVNGRSGDRAWADEKKAAEQLTKWGVTAYEQVIISPVEAEKRLLALPLELKKKEAATVVTDLTYRAPGRPSLVQVKDERAALDDNDAIDGVFEEIE